MINTAKLQDPSLIYWRRTKAMVVPTHECFINDQMVAWIEARNGYCDRGHYKLVCELPDIDHQDGFPRYYMRLKVAKRECEDFLRWRLWKVRAERVPFQEMTILLDASHLKFEAQ